MTPVSKGRESDHVTVVGAGVVGCTIAALLSQAGLRVAIVDHAAIESEVAPSDYDLRVLVLTTGSERILTSAGAWSQIVAERFGRLCRMHVWDAGQPEGVQFDSVDVGRPNLGFIVEQRVVLQALLDTLKTAPAVSWYRPAQLGEIVRREDHLNLRLSDDRVIRTKLLIGADGQHSQVRTLAGIKTTGADYHQHAVVASVRTEHAHGETARQIFLPSGPLAFLPLHEPTLCSIVWSTGDSHARRLCAANSGEFNQQLASAFEQRLGKVLWSSERRSFALSRAHATTYIGTRLALIGDAAHTIHPLAGQGANLGLLDAAALAQSIAEAAERGFDIGNPRVLRRYERWRRGENQLMQWSLDALKAMFASERNEIRSVRDFGLRVTDKIVPLKRLIIGHASGLSGDLPRAAR